MVTPALAHRERLESAFGGRSPGDLEAGTVLVIPSITFPAEELRKIVGIQHYEERLLCLLLQLRNRGLRMVYVTSAEVDPSVVDYYLSFVEGSGDARSRLTLIALDDVEPRALSEKLIERPEVLAKIRAACDADTYMLTFNVTPLELRLAEELDVHLYGPHPEIVSLGSKSGARRIATMAGVPVLPGTEHVTSRAELVEALRALRPAAAAVVKLNNGFSGQGNAIVDLGALREPLEETPTVFCAGEESWSSFLPKIESEGAIVEEHARARGLVSPSVQLRALPDGSVEVVSTHDQILGSPDDQVYLGCRFPADPLYRTTIADHALKVGRALAHEGVIGPFGIDFLVIPSAGGAHEVFLSEINLRMGGTTHPFLMAHMVTGGDYDRSSGELLVDGTPRCYVATDNLKNPTYVGLEPKQVIAAVEDAGLTYESTTATGVLLHLLGALPSFGKLGATCIAHGPDGAQELYLSLVELLDRLQA
jgi:hypothetical protein